MKKILRFLTCMIILVLLCNSHIIKASNNKNDDFMDIEFTSTPLLTQSNKSKCTITWKTNEQIKYLKVSIQLQNNKEQIPYESGRENSAGSFDSVILDNGQFYNILEIEVDNSQLGNIKIKFDYSYQIILPDLSADIYTFVAVFVTGKWIDKQPTHNGFLVGIFITFVAALATYVIIENSRREVMNDSEEIEESIDE